VVPKRGFQTTSRRVITQKTEKFSATMAEDYDLVKYLSRGRLLYLSFLDILTLEDGTDW
jgi:hypothetical protein